MGVAYIVVVHICSSCSHHGVNLCAINCDLKLVLGINCDFVCLSLFCDICLLIFIFFCNCYCISVKWYTFSCDTAFVLCNINLLIFLCCCFIPVGFTDYWVCDTAFRMQHTKFGGGMCNTVKLGSPLVTSFHHLHVWF